MKYYVHHKKIHIDDALIDEYEENVDDVNELILQYLAETGGTTPDSSAKELEKVISEGMQEEISVYKDIPNILKRIEERLSRIRFETLGLLND